MILGKNFARVSVQSLINNQNQMDLFFFHIDGQDVTRQNVKETQVQLEYTSVAVNEELRQ